MKVACSLRLLQPRSLQALRRYATTASTKSHDLLIVGGGTAGINIAQQIKQTYESQGSQPPAMSIIDKAELHHYQPGWTLVGAGLKDKSELNTPMAETIPAHAQHIKNFVREINAEENSLITDDGVVHSYKSLILCPGIKLNYGAVEGLREAMGKNGVSSIYDYDYCDNVWSNIKDLESGTALFTQPKGDIKCAGAPQKIMWMAEDYWRKVGRRGAINVEFTTALPKMFGVQKYSDILRGLTQSRNVTPNFETVLTKVDGKQKIAEFTTASGEKIQKKYDFLHATIPMAPHDFIKNSSVANAAGHVEVSEKTLQSTKFPNVWSLGDASSLPTSKTAAAVMSQTPILAHNFYNANHGKALTAEYDGYTSCPLLVGYGKLILAEFGYGGQIKETFANYGLDQGTPSRWAYHLKKDLFPAVYFSLFTKGLWYGRNGFIKPRFE